MPRLRIGIISRLIENRAFLRPLYASIRNYLADQRSARYLWDRERKIEIDSWHRGLAQRPSASLISSPFLLQFADSRVFWITVSKPVWCCSESKLKARRDSYSVPDNCE